MAMPPNVVISDKMQLGAPTATDIQQRQWLMDERDRFISWLRGEFAAANAVIDSLCHHLRSIGDPGEYDVVMSCIQQRRCNWNPVLHMQQYFSIAEVQYALQQATWKRQQRPHFDSKMRVPDKDLKKSGSRQWFRVDSVKESQYSNREVVSSNRDVVSSDLEKGDEKMEKSDGKLDENVSVVDKEGTDGTTNSDTNTGSKVSGNPVGPECDNSKSEAVNHEGPSTLKGTCNASLKSGSEIIKHDEIHNLVSVPKTFVATEMFDGKPVNVVEGLKFYEELFSSTETSRLVKLANDLRSTGRRGQLQGQAFVISKRPMKGRGREMIQLGLQIADAPQEDTFIGTSEERKMEPIPILLKDVIERIVSSQITAVEPDSCIIDFFNEGDHSQPHMFPPWFGRPVCILFLTECDLTFGRVIGVDRPGDYRGSLKLSLLPGSLLSMQGKSTDLAKYAISSIRKQRIVVTFTKSQPKKTVLADGHRLPSSVAPLPMAWGSVPNRAPSHVRHPAGTKHYGPVTTGVLPVPAMHQQHIPPPSSMQPVFVSSPVAPAMPFPAPVPVPPTSSGWAAVPGPRHTPPRLPVPGTGVFLPPPGSGSSQTPLQPLSATATQGSMPVEKPAPMENENSLEKLNCNTNSSPKGKSDGNAERKECNGSALSEKVVGKEEQQPNDLKKTGKLNDGSS